MSDDLRRAAPAGRIVVHSLDTYERQRATRARAPAGASGAGTSRPRAARPAPAPSPFWVDLLQLVGLCSFAFAQPLLNVLAEDAVFFVMRSSQPVDVWVIALMLSLGLPLLLGAVELLAGLGSRRARRALHVVLVGALLAVIALPLLTRNLEPPGTGVLPVALLLGVAGALVYLRWAPARSLATSLVIGAPLFAGGFLLDPNVREIGADFDPSQVARDPGTDATVAVLLLDELPLGALLDGELRIDARLFPNFARLADESTWFRNATASHELTEGVMPALLSGRRPRAGALPTAAQHPRNLFTLFGGSHRMLVRELKTSLCPVALIEDDGTIRTDLGLRLRALAADLPLLYAHIVLPDCLTGRLPSVEGEWKDFWVDDAELRRKGPGGLRPADDAPLAAGDAALGADDVARAADTAPMARPADTTPAARPAGRSFHSHRPRELRDYLDVIDGESRPTLYFLHSLLPHNPWMFTHTGAQYVESKEQWPGGDGVWPAHAWPDGLQRMLLQLGHLDALLGEWIERLRGQGVYERALIVVTADHGVSFEPGLHFRFAEQGNLRDLMHVPLFVKAPFQREGRVVDANVESIDLLPTLADALEVELPWPVDGRSAWGPEVAEREHKQFMAKAGATFTLPAELPARWPVLERKRALFGERPDWDAIHAMGPAPHLVGRRLDGLSLRRDGAPSVRAVLRDAEAFAAVDTVAGVVPCRIAGHLLDTGGVRARELAQAPLAIVVNGVVRAVTGTTPGPWESGADGDHSSGTASRAEDGAAAGVRRSFAAMVPDRSFHDGSNRVELFLVLPGDEIVPCAPAP